jgi:hypothetical protein
VTHDVTRAGIGKMAADHEHGLFLEAIDERHARLGDACGAAGGAVKVGAIAQVAAAAEEFGCAYFWMTVAK